MINVSHYKSLAFHLSLKWTEEELVNMEWPKKWMLLFLMELVLKLSLFIKDRNANCLTPRASNAGQ